MCRKTIKKYKSIYNSLLTDSNYSGIEKDMPSNNLSLTKKEFSKEELALINKDKEECVLNKNDISELIYIQVLKSLLLLIIIH